MRAKRTQESQRPGPHLSLPPTQIHTPQSEICTPFRQPLTTGLQPAQNRTNVSRLQHPRPKYHIWGPSALAPALPIRKQSFYCASKKHSLRSNKSLEYISEKSGPIHLHLLKVIKTISPKPAEVIHSRSFRTGACL